MDELYPYLSEEGLLQRAWHIARKDSGKNFVEDTFGLSDFALRLPEFLSYLSASLRTETYEPRPLAFLDVPKSRLASRPGSVLSAQDHVVASAIVYLLAPRIDGKIPKSVYSYRLKPGYIFDDELFEDTTTYHRPFLRNTRIQREIEIIEPWYGAWPRFFERMREVDESREFPYLLNTDITAYFENIDLQILRDQIIGLVPNQARLNNFLFRLLKRWTWPALEGLDSPRGIPQGNSVSSFLGNIYLLPIDLRFKTLDDAGEIVYLRYMDDIKIFTKTEESARECLRILARELRALRLTLQGSKTEILHEKEIHEELFDPRVDEATDLINRIRRLPEDVPVEPRTISALAALRDSIELTENGVEPKDARLYQRLLTAHLLAREASMTTVALKSLSLNHDAKLFQRNLNYLRQFMLENDAIAPAVFCVATGASSGSGFHRGLALWSLAWAAELPPGASESALNHACSSESDWILRLHAARLLATAALSDVALLEIKKAFDNEKKSDVRRALCVPLAQMNPDSTVQFIRSLVKSVDPALQQVGCFYDALRTEDQRALQLGLQLASSGETVLLSHLHELDVITTAQNKLVRDTIADHLRRRCTTIERPWLRERLHRLHNRAALGLFE